MQVPLQISTHVFAINIPKLRTIIDVATTDIRMCPRNLYFIPHIQINRTLNIGQREVNAKLITRHQMKHPSRISCLYKPQPQLLYIIGKRGFLINTAEAR